MTATGRLTTHILDTALGRPAAGMQVALFHIEGEARTLLKIVATNGDGRVDTPLLEGDALVRGTYELVFHAGDYLKASGTTLSDPPFLDAIPLRFGIADLAAHYHVPLLLSPYSYSTYRGS